MSNSDFLRMATNAQRKSNGEGELDPLEFFSFVTPKVGLFDLTSPRVMLQRMFFSSLFCFLLSAYS